MNTKQLTLSDPEIFPSDEILKKVLGVKVIEIYSELLGAAMSPNLGLFLEWRYY